MAEVRRGKVTPVGGDAAQHRDLEAGFLDGARSSRSELGATGG